MNDDVARNRFMVLNLVRLGGIAMVMIALAIHYRKIEAPEVLAYILAAAGLVEYFYLPRLLSRKWRTPWRTWTSRSAGRTWKTPSTARPPC